jgi:PKHD-type hydroxylase
MFLRVPNVLTPAALAECRDILDHAPWTDGRLTAGTQAGQSKRNRQLADDAPASIAARRVVLDGLARSALFFAAALPKHIFPPLFNRYDGDMNAFGNHVDNAVRTIASNGQNVRTDLAATLFLSDPDRYDGGELVIDHAYGTGRIKLPPGDLALYPATTVHRVEPVTRGLRIASFFWIESMVRHEAQRTLLFDLDMSILALRERLGDSAEVIRLTGSYHNLLRMWAHV